MLRLTKLLRLTAIRSIMTKGFEGVERPELDSRQYRVVRLQTNDLEALLVHDADTDKASAAMDVNAGHLSDPEDLPGLAHYCEHLLFMGTKKYPTENEYSQYLSSHSGRSNAFTGLTNTNYFFDVGQEYLHGALDRFAQFFIEPLFLEECKDREILAVDSENKKNLQSDVWRFYQLEKSLSNASHPYHKFGTGNLQTLGEIPKAKGLDVRDELLAFHGRQYSANRMKLVVLGRESLDELQSWVEGMFSQIDNRRIAAPDFSETSPFGEDQLGRVVFSRPVMETRNIELTFPIPDQELLFESLPAHYMTHLLGHEGPGSVLSYLKNLGWANALGSGASHISRGSEVFKVHIDLTESGLEHYKEVAATIFRYIAIVRLSGPQKWIFDELQQMGQVNFRFKQRVAPMSYTSTLSQTMRVEELPRAWLLNAASVFRKFDPAGIEDVIASLVPENCKIDVAAIELFQAPDEKVEKEKWYGTEYRTEKFDQDFLRLLKSGPEIKGLHLPHKNEFIPARFDVDRKLVDTRQLGPHLILRNASKRIWHKNDDTFWLPRAEVMILMRSPVALATAASAVKTKLFCELVEDALVEYSYDAEISGLQYELRVDHRILRLQLSGFSDRMPVLLTKILEAMRDLDFQPERFEVLRDKLARDYRNWDMSMPFRQVTEWQSYIHREKYWLVKEKLQQVSQIDQGAVIEHAREVLGRMHVETLVHGVFSEQEALELSSLVDKILSPQPLAPPEPGLPKSLQMPNGHSFWRRTLADAAEVNSCISYIIECGDLGDDVLRNKVLLLTQIFQEPAFDMLRAKEQLGYIVSAGSIRSASTIGLLVLVQSERDTDYVQGRIEAFLQHMEGVLRDMSNEEWEMHVASLIARRLEKPKELSEEANRFMGQITSGYYDFWQPTHDAALLKEMKQTDLVEFYAKVRQHVTFALHLQAKTSNGSGTMSGHEIKDAAEFKGGLTVLPEARPVLPWEEYEKPNLPVARPTLGARL